MPRYFFHIEDGEKITDNVGTDLLDDVEAKNKALRVSSAAIYGLGRRFWDHAGWQMTVVDESGRVVLTLHSRGEVRQGDAP